MALTFDISRAPPAAADIAVEREHTVHGLELIRKKNNRFLIIAVASLAAILCFQVFVAIPAVGDEGTDPTIVGVIALYTPYVIGIFFFTSLTLHHKMIEKPRKLLYTTLDALKEATPEALSKVGDAGQDHAEIAAYRAQVAAQGRSLVQAEIDAMWRWLDARRRAHAGA